MEEEDFSWEHASIGNRAGGKYYNFNDLPEADRRCIYPVDEKSEVVGKFV